MGIHRDGGHIINNAGHHVGCFLPYARQLHQGFNVAGNNAVEPLHQHVARPQEILSLSVIETTVPNLRLHFLQGQRPHLLRRVQTGKDTASDHVHPLVRALGR